MARMYKIINHSVKLKKFFNNVFEAIKSVKGIAIVTLIFLYTSAVLAMNLFAYQMP
jgi:hypothetical protein